MRTSNRVNSILFAILGILIVVLLVLYLCLDTKYTALEKTKTELSIKMRLRGDSIEFLKEERDSLYSMLDIDIEGVADIVEQEKDFSLKFTTLSDQQKDEIVLDIINDERFKIK